MKIKNINKKRREQQTEKANPLMITSTKNYSEKKKNPRTNGKSKAIQTNHTKKHTHTHSQKEQKERKNIYIYI